MVKNAKIVNGNLYNILKISEIEIINVVCGNLSHLSSLYDKYYVQNLIKFELKFTGY